MTEQPAGRRLLIVFNPAAGLRRRQRLEAVLRRLRRHGCQAEVLETRGPGDAERFAAGADPVRYDLLVVAGGNGLSPRPLMASLTVPSPPATTSRS